MDGLISIFRLCQYSIAAVLLLILADPSIVLSRENRCAFLVGTIHSQRSPEELVSRLYQGTSKEAGQTGDALVALGTAAVPALEKALVSEVMRLPKQEFDSQSGDRSTKRTPSEKPASSAPLRRVIKTLAAIGSPAKDTRDWIEYMADNYPKFRTRYTARGALSRIDNGIRSFKIAKIREELRPIDPEVADWMTTQIEGIEKISVREVELIARALKHPNMKLILQNTSGRITFHGKDETTLFVDETSPGFYNWLTRRFHFTDAGLGTKASEIFLHELTHRFSYQLWSALPQELRKKISQLFNERLAQASLSRWDRVLLRLQAYNRLARKPIQIDRFFWELHQASSLHEYLAYGVQLYFADKAGLRRLDRGLFQLIDSLFGERAAPLAIER